MLSILQVSTSDLLGGAESIALGLFEAYRSHGHRSSLAVGYKRTHDPDILLLPNDKYRSICGKSWTSIAKILSPFEGRIRGATRLRHLVQACGEPRRLRDILSGREDFHFPGIYKVFDSLASPPDLIHCHNLHGYYFDLTALPWLSRQAPLVLTLHDAWLLSGHCAHSFDCERWTVGCGQCPDLSIYPSLLRDGTAYNWQRKKDIFAESHLYVATPCEWLMQKVRRSMLVPAIREARIIPNGIDLSLFRPGNQREARAYLGIPCDARMLLFAGKNLKRNIWKDFGTIRAAVSRVAQYFSDELHFIILGNQAAEERVGQMTIHSVPFQNDPHLVARYYQAADVYIHAARADTFPNSVLESLACGTPVVATAVGGIPEQIEDSKTGFVVPQGDAQAMATRVIQLLSDQTLRREMGAIAAEVASRRFDINQQVKAYLTWYQEILDRSGERKILKA